MNLGVGMAWTGASDTLTRVTTWFVCSRALAYELNTGMSYALAIGVANEAFYLSSLEIQKCDVGHRVDSHHSAWRIHGYMQYYAYWTLISELQALRLCKTE